MSIALITGGSSGIGFETANALREKGVTVYEMSRRESHQDGVIHLSGDVTNKEDIEAAVNTVISKEGRIDILINNAGFGISGAAEFTPIEAAQKQFNVNFFGLCSMCSSVIPHMRKNGGGRIVNISSVAAVAPISFQAFYSASKACINSYSIALGNEVKDFGISVTAIMPGDIKTCFTDVRESEYIGDDIYGGKIHRSVEKMESDEKNGMSPQSAGRYIARIALKKKVKPLYAIRIDYKFLSVLARILPVRTLSWLLRKLYVL